MMPGYLDRAIGPVWYAVIGPGILIISGHGQLLRVKGLLAVRAQKSSRALTVALSSHQCIAASLSFPSQ